MTERNEGGQFPQDRYRDSEAQLGGADAVEKTTYVVGSGTDPEARARPGVPSARTPARRSALLWVVLLVAAAVAVVYLAGIVG